MGSDTLEEDIKLKEDIKLWRKCTGGDKSAWDSLVKKYSKLVNNTIWATLRRYPNPGGTDVKDVYQDVFVKLLEKLDQWQRRATLATYIRAIAFRTTIDWLRERRYVPLEDEQPVNPNSESTILAEELLRILSPPEQLLLRLHYIEGQSLEEVAQFLNKSVGAIYTMKSRALEKLRKIDVK